MAETPELNELLEHWRLPEVTSVTRVAAGMNNLTWKVQTADRAFILRVYQNATDIEQIRFEHALLEELGRQGLSFAVPLPEVSRFGETSVRMSEGAGTLVTLSPFIEGTQPDLADL